MHFQIFDFQTGQFSIEGFRKPFRYDRNVNGGGLLDVREKAPVKELKEYSFPLGVECSIIEINMTRFLRSSETDLKIPLLKTINGQKAFSYRGAKLWNNLERATKLAPSLKIFKDHL